MASAGTWRAWTAEFGVPARLMIDFQTLVGDAVDNVPGVCQSRAPRPLPSGCRSSVRSTTLVANGPMPGQGRGGARTCARRLPAGQLALPSRAQRWSPSRPTATLNGYVPGLPASGFTSRWSVPSSQRRPAADFYSKSLASKAWCGPWPSGGAGRRCPLPLRRRAGRSRSRTRRHARATPVICLPTTPKAPWPAVAQHRSVQCTTPVT